MIRCVFENKNIASPGLRHITLGGIIVNENNEILLVKRSQNIFNGGKFTIPGGFLDRDESAMAGMLRELKEETGYIGEILNLFLINDNPNRPKEDRQNVDFIYIIKVVGGQPILNSEASDISWFRKENLPKEDEFAFDHRNIILRYFEYLDKEVPLPIINWTN